MTKIIDRLTYTLVFLVALGAFALSYSNLYDTALAYGLPPRLAWIWPLLVDFALVVFSLAVVRASLYSERTWWPWLLVALYTVATVAFNILHAPANLTARIVAVVAPLSLFLSFETLMAMLKSEVTRRGVSLSLAAMKQELERIGVEIGLGKDELDQASGELQQASSSLESIRGEFSRLSEEATRKAQEVSDLEAKTGELLVQVEKLTAQKAELKSEVLGNAYGPSASRRTDSSPPPAKVSPENAQELSERQRRLLELLGQGKTQEAMAGELGIHVSTVKRELVKLNGLAEEVRS